jgi:hypothetical protein
MSIVLSYRKMIAQTITFLTSPQLEYCPGSRCFEKMPKIQKSLKNRIVVPTFMLMQNKRRGSNKHEYEPNNQSKGVKKPP